MAPGPLLIVEDSDDDFYALQRALGKTLPCALMRCYRGEDALDYLFQRGTYPEAVRPSLILLDLNMPGKDGHTILKLIKQDAGVCDIPVVIFSTSNNPNDIKRCYRAGAAGYIMKPLNYTRLRQALHNLCLYWFQTVVLPDRE